METGRRTFGLKEKKPPKYPHMKTLTAALSTVLRDNGYIDRNLTVLERKPNPYGSTFPTEVVTCRPDGGGSTLRLFIKYGTKKFDSVYGHRGDVSYEAKVYRDVLGPLQASTPIFYGVHKEDEPDAPWLIVEYLARGSPASSSRDPNAMVRSAQWIGKFHAANEKRVHSPRLNFLHRYDSKYYLGWASRTRKLFNQPRLRMRFPWLAPLCDEFEMLIPGLLRARPAVIHGEYFGSNIIYQKGVSRPVDWQSAAIAPGEIDLASLTHSWPRLIVEKCEREYTRARWPGGVPDGFEETLGVARVYMNLRWLGDPGLMSPLVLQRGKPFVSNSILLSMQAVLHLYSVGEKLGLL